MRAAFLALMFSLLILSAQPAPATSPLLPGMSVTLDPATASANISQNQSVTVKFNGVVKVSQNRLSSMTVKLTSKVDTGWPSACSPASFSIRGSGSQKFDCTVTVPGNTTNDTADLDVTAQGTTRALIVTNHAKAVITLDIKNQTLAGNQTTKNTGGGGAGGGKAGGLDPMVLTAVAVVVIAAVAGGGGYMVIKRRKARLPLAA